MEIILQLSWWWCSLVWADRIDGGGTVELGRLLLSLEITACTSMFLVRIVFLSVPCIPEGQLCFSMCCPPFVSFSCSHSVAIDSLPQCRHNMSYSDVNNSNSPLHTEHSTILIPDLASSTHGQLSKEGHWHLCPEVWVVGGFEGK